MNCTKAIFAVKCYVTAQQAGGPSGKAFVVYSIAKTQVPKRVTKLQLRLGGGGVNS